MGTTTRDQRLAWWREARFGLFIHWGIYALPAGTWKGQQIPSLGEWIMFNAGIPVPEYEQLAAEFNPVHFDADQWVRLAKDAGMKYLVITAKHHDGFAMFRSPSDPFNIVDATPFGRDPMTELAAACSRHGLKLGFYYSQSQDWHEPDAAHTMRGDRELNTAGFQRYLERKVKPQLRELLTQYGPIGLIWFDTPAFISAEQSRDLREFVLQIQPDCLVSGRLGNDLGDYGSMGDNQIPAGRVRGDWETPATLNDTWGFKSNDHNWKSLPTLLLLLVDLASKGVNYLLNVGPTAAGRIPQPSVELLAGIGRWMAVNGEAIHGSEASPYPYEFEWGRITRKPGRLYLHFCRWPGKRFQLRGLRNDVLSASLLSDPDAPIAFQQSYLPTASQSLLTLQLPEQPPGNTIDVLELELDGDALVDALPQPQNSGLISLPAHMADIRNQDPDSRIRIGRAGISENWHSTRNALAWQFRSDRPGRFQVHILTAPPNRWTPWSGGHQVSLVTDGQHLQATIGDDLSGSNSPRAAYLEEKTTCAGIVFLGAGGAHDLLLTADSILHDQAQTGLCVVAVDLVPLQEADTPL